MDIDSFSRNIIAATQEFTPILSTRFTQQNYVPIDLSITNKALDTIDINSSLAFERHINAYLEARSAKVAYGGYMETRGIYRRSKDFNQQNSETERNIHLGLDFWCDAGTELIAPLDGVIHSFQNNHAFADYGPTIILQHKTRDITFYTLYGHLSVDSLQGLSIGGLIKKGQSIARLGEAAVNGDYAPHLHFQIINDLQGKQGDYPGVSNKKDVEFYKQNCPDPNLLLKIC